MWGKVSHRQALVRKKVSSRRRRFWRHQQRCRGQLRPTMARRGKVRQGRASLRVKGTGKGEKKKKAVPSRLRLQEDRVDPRGLARNPYERVHAAKGETRKGPVLETYHLNRKEKRLMRGTSASTREWIPQVRTTLSVVASET